MDRSEHEHNFESIERISIAPPAVESFLSMDAAREVWPEHITENQEFQSRIESRQQLNEHLDAVIDNLPAPNITLEDAIVQGYLTEAQVTDLYSSMSDLLENGSDYRRIILYTPFEFLPDKKWRASTPGLQQQTQRFSTAYMSAWKGLLATHDVRANFVDGDVLDVESRTEDLPRVVKAAHLIPMLVKKGLLDYQQISDLVQSTDDELLKKNVNEALAVLGDFDRGQTIQTPDSPGISFDSINSDLANSFSKIESENFGSVTDKRATWLKQNAKDKAVESSGKKIAAAIINDKFGQEQQAKFAEEGADRSTKLALIEGLRTAIELTARNNPNQAKQLYAEYGELLKTLWRNDQNEIRAGLTKTFSRLHQLGIVGDEQLKELGIDVPDLVAPFSENIKNLEPRIKEIKTALAAIKQHPELSQSVYPVALIYGSRLKGYGNQSADIDMAMFIKPSVDETHKDQLRAQLKQVFAGVKPDGEIIEFWLEQSSEGLTIRDQGKNFDPARGESSWTHILFGAAWEGDPAIIKDLREKILVTYLRKNHDQQEQSRNTRNLYLEEMERDAVQYRLLHKGYADHKATYGLGTPHADRIDGQSTFWDSGYRQTATKLFASRVFLPTIS